MQMCLERTKKGRQPTMYTVYFYLERYSLTIYDGRRVELVGSTTYSGA